ncbi:MAG: hypothetical protein NVSMB62_07170 [Acidobacteriaceae bacterium]
MGEPFGKFGTMMPVGHTAIYLDRVCADGPLKLRACRPGEPAGVVVARYHSIGPYDWMATPILQFLYAAERPEEIPAYVTADQVWEMRQTYRRRYLSGIVPDGKEKDGPVSEWWETAGIAYNRRVWGYQIDTTEEQDLRFIARMNADPNRHLYHLRRTNCANFAADVVNFYFAGLVPRGDHIADFGLMTPKQVARCVADYGGSHPEAHLQVLEIPQVPGTLRRSRPVRGAAEAGLKTKRYLATLLALQPEVPIALTFLYLDHGRWQIGRGATVATPSELTHEIPAAGDIVAAR